MPSNRKTIGGGPLREPPDGGSFMVGGPQAAWERKGFLGPGDAGKPGHQG
jgi:hypothetical protein